MNGHLVHFTREEILSLLRLLIWLSELPREVVPFGDHDYEALTALARRLRQAAPARPSGNGHAPTP